MGRSHKDGATKEQILFDGWSRGFCISQVINELDNLGFVLDAAEVQVAFDQYQCEMEYHYMSNDE